MELMMVDWRATQKVGYSVETLAHFLAVQWVSQTAAQLVMTMARKKVAMMAD